MVNLVAVKFEGFSIPMMMLERETREQFEERVRMKTFTFMKEATFEWSGDNELSATIPQIDIFRHEVKENGEVGLYLERIPSDGQDILFPNTYKGYKVCSIEKVSVPESITERGRTLRKTPNVFIAGGIERVEGYAFYNWKIGKIYFTEGLKSIGNAAFWNAGLEGVITLPESLEEVEIDAFEVNNIQQVIFPETPVKFASGVFRSNDIRELTTPRWMKSIPSYMFESNRGLKKITFHEGLEEITKSAFEECGVEVVEFPESLKRIGSFAFNDCNLKELKLPKSLERICENAFIYNHLEKIEFNEGILEIESSAFFANKLTEVTIPKSIKNIHDNVFAENAITSVTLHSEVKSIGREAFAGNEITEIHIPDSVELIHDEAFHDNKIYEVYIPDSVVRLGMDSFGDNENVFFISLPKHLLFSLSNSVRGNADYTYEIRD